MAIRADEKRVPASPTAAACFDVGAQSHRFGAGGSFIQERCVGDRQRGQVGDQRLKIEQGFQASLSNLGLVRRVLRVPAGIFQDFALDHRRRDARGEPHADVRAEDLVARGDFAQAHENPVLAERRRQA